MDYQKLILVGNATEAVEVNEPEGKTPYADFTVAVSRGKDKTDFFPVRAFDKLAQQASKIEKGSKVLVEGRVEIGRFEPEDGEPKTTVRVVADRMRYL